MLRARWSRRPSRTRTTVPGAIARIGSPNHGYSSGLLERSANRTTFGVEESDTPHTSIAAYWPRVLVPWLGNCWPGPLSEDQLPRTGGARSNGSWSSWIGARPMSIVSTTNATTTATTTRNPPGSPRAGSPGTTAVTTSSTTNAPSSSRSASQTGLSPAIVRLTCESPSASWSSGSGARQHDRGLGRGESTASPRAVHQEPRHD